MDALANAWLGSVASSPIAGAVAMVGLIIVTNVLRVWLPWLQPAGGGGAKPAAEPAELDGSARQIQSALDHAGEHLEQAADHLRLQCEMVRRQAEALERLERTIAVLVAQQAPRSAPAPRRGAAS